MLQIWDDEAKELTKQAAMDAGIAEKEIYMISEPEAAAVHVLTDLDGVKGNLKVRPTTYIITRKISESLTEVFRLGTYT